MKKEIRDLEDVRNNSGEVRSMHTKDFADDYSNHPEGCTCGHCGKDHSHKGMSHVPVHTHEGMTQEHSHGDACGAVDCCCGNDDKGSDEEDDSDHHHGHNHEHHHEGSCGCVHDHYEHHHEESCCCGHDHHDHHHEDSCSCGHDHHEHHHEESCGCGHDHHEHNYHVSGHPDNCQCERCHPHEDYCDVCGKSLALCTCVMPDADKLKRVYILKNLGCANCAAKMEHKIKELPGVTYANISFVTKQLRLSAADHEAVLPLIREICSSIESDVEVIPRNEKPASHKDIRGEHRVYMVQHLDCANCGAKIERALNQMAEVDEAVLTFTTKKLKVKAASYEGLLEKMQAVTDSVEEGVVLIELSKSTNTAAHNESQNASLVEKLGDKLQLIEIILGGIVFIATEWLSLIPEAYHLYCLVFAYVLLGGRIVWTAVKNIAKGHVFDENFLMTVATLGAFAIKAWEEAVGVMFFYRVGEFFEQRAVEKSRGQIMEAVDMRPQVVNLLMGDKVEVIGAEEAHVGDILLVRVGDRIPLDGIVIDGESLVDTSPVTGEPVPVKKQYGDEVVSGCVNTSGMLKIRVEKVLEESMVTKILDSVENAAASKPAIDRFITRFARVYTPFVVAAAVLTAVIPSLITGEGEKWIYTALTFLVISCPCALVLSVPLAFFSGIGAGSKYGILFKGGVAMEALKNVAAVVMDKTGTITKGNFVLQEIKPNGVNEDELLCLCAGAEQVSTHPIAVSIVAAAKERGLKLVRPDFFEEIAGEGLVAEIAGKTVLCGNTKLMQRYEISCAGYKEAIYGSEVLVAVDGKYYGQLLINDTLKEDAKAAVSALKNQGLVTAMLTGDAEREANAVAAAAGVDEVRAKLLPQDKLNALNELRNKYGSVMFVGDGINDAPVLSGANVGAAMGSGADAAIEAADVVFMNSEMKSIPQAIAIAKATGAIAWQNVVFALAVKVIIMIAGLMGYASMWAAVFADTGVTLLCELNSIRILYKKV